MTPLTSDRSKTAPARRLAVAVLASIAVVITACSSDTAASPPGSTPDTTDSGGASARIDWTQRQATIETGNGWTVDFCDGDAPLLCVSDGDRPVGAVELASYDRPAFDDLTDWAEDFYATMLADRRAGCGEDFTLDGVEPAEADLGGHPGISYGFTVRDGDGEPTDGVLGYAAVVDDSLFLLVAAAYDPDGCVGTEGGEFTTEDLAEFGPTLRAIAATSDLPEPLHRP